MSEWLALVLAWEAVVLSTVAQDENFAVFLG